MGNNEMCNILTPVAALSGILFSNFINELIGSKGLTHVMISPLYQSTGRRFTASTRVFIGSCCDQNISKENPFKIQN